MYKYVYVYIYRNEQFVFGSEEELREAAPKILREWEQVRRSRLYEYFSLSPSFSLSLYIYIYILIYTCMHIFFIYIFARAYI